jgi:uncharacterized protein YkvS
MSAAIKKLYHQGERNKIANSDLSDILNFMDLIAASHSNELNGAASLVLITWQTNWQDLRRL